MPAPDSTPEKHRDPRARMSRFPSRLCRRISPPNFHRCGPRSSVKVCTNWYVALVRWMGSVPVSPTFEYPATEMVG